MPHQNKSAISVARRTLLYGLGTAAAALYDTSAWASIEEDTKLREKIVRRYAEAWSQGDFKAIVDSYHDDMTLHYFGHNPMAGDHVGKAASLKTLAEARLNFESYVGGGP